jgi:hypothetical protein
MNDYLLYNTNGEKLNSTYLRWEVDTRRGDIFLLQKILGRSSLEVEKNTPICAVMI